MNDDQHFAAFAQDLQALFTKYFQPGTRAVVAFALLSDLEVRYVMNVPKPVGIALLEQAADLARQELETPFHVVNPGKLEGLARDILKDHPRLKVGESQIVDLIRQELKTTMDVEKAFNQVKHRLLANL